MPIASYKPDTNPPVVTPNIPKVEPSNYKSIIYDDKNIPLHSLISYIEGSSWTVDFYSQVVSRDNDLREVDPGQPTIYQQYQKINKLELRVDASLSSSYDSDTGITTVNGSANIYPFIIPNVSDYFVTDAGDNRTALFRVTNVERKTFNRDSVYAIDYVMVGYTDAVGALYTELTDKVIREYHFSKDRLLEGLSPILKTTDYEQITNLKASYKDLVEYYFKMFFNRRYMTLVVPGQEVAVYDSYLINYIRRIIDSTLSLDYKHMKTIPTDGDVFLKQLQFWDILYYRDYDLLKQANRNMQLVTKHLFTKNSYLHGLAYSNIDYIVYPSSPEITTMIDQTEISKTISTDEVIIEVANYEDTIASLLTDQYTDVNSVYPIMQLVTVDDSYVLSNDFYDNTANMSLLEQLTKDYIKKQTLDLTKLNALVNKYRGWGRLEQFYYGPILMTLLLEADRSTYT